jgi:TrmH family RNA methyltransferase
MIITSRQNSVIKQYRKINEDVFLVEGAKLINEALKGKFTPQSALFTGKTQEKHLDLYTEISKLCPVFVISSDISEYISDTKTPQGVFALFTVKHPDYTVDIKNHRQAGFAGNLMFLDGVRDPGNMGAVIRSCDAFGFAMVVCSENSADAFTGKVIRASAGSVFRIPVIRCSLPEIIPDYKNIGYNFYAAALTHDAIPLQETDFKNSGQSLPAGKNAVVIGNEGTGISDEVLSLCGQKIYIPVKNVESLNAAVAAGIICYEMKEI